MKFFSNVLRADVSNLRHYSIAMMIVLFSCKLFAEERVWEKVTVPNVKCGSGENYNVFIRRGDVDKVAVGFAAGGACWSESTCFGMLALTNLRPLTELHLNEALLSTNQAESPLANFTHIYFPYCTGDVFLGSHIATYGKKKVSHTGRELVEQTLTYIKDQQTIPTDGLDSIVLYGFSAGAIGALYHGETVRNIFGSAPHQSIISDSPGMHFGKDFWKKFTPELLKDFTYALGKIGIPLNKEDGFVGKYVLDLCNHYADWDVAILQSARDFVMSTVFGNTSGSEHKKLIYGPNGIVNLTKDETDRCMVWSPDSSSHVFLFSQSASRSVVNKKTAMGFASDILKGEGGQNYSDLK